MESVDTQDLKSCARLERSGSSPEFRKQVNGIIKVKPFAKAKLNPRSYLIAQYANLAQW